MNLAEKIRALFTTYSGVFKGALDAATGDWTKVATKVQSTSTVNTYGWLGQSATFRDWVGARVAQAIATFGYTIANKTKEMTVEIKKEDVEDDNVGIYSPLVQDMGQEAVRDIDAMVFGAFKANGVCYDGKTYFAVDHPMEFESDGTPSVGADTFSNVIAPADPEDATAAWYAMDCSRVIKPVLYQERKAAVFVSKTALDDETVFRTNMFTFGADKRDNVGYTLPQFAIKCTKPLTAESFAEVQAALEEMAGDKGKALGLKCTTIVVPPSLRADAKALLATQFLANGGSNPHFGDAEYIVTPYVK
jgi:phage major head subunit gpT-like protein